MPTVPSGISPNELESTKIIDLNKDLVRKSLNFINSERYYYADGRTPSQCSFTTYKYKIFKRNNALYLESNLFFDGDLEKLDIVRQCLSEAKTFYNRYDVNLVVYESESQKADHEINLIDKNGRSDSKNWYLKSETLCNTIIHEVSHLFGLPDEYKEDDTCRTKDFESKEINPYSVMAYSSNNLKHLQLMPRHILAILEQAIRSEITLNPKFDGSFSKLFPQCNSLYIQRNFKAGQLITIQEGLGSEYISRKSENIWRQELFFHLPNLDGKYSPSGKWICHDLGDFQSFADWKWMFDDANIDAESEPFSFDDHVTYLYLYNNSLHDSVEKQASKRE